jgi:hypothetical protein
MNDKSVVQQIREAIAEERERCAKIADSSAVNISAGYGWGAWTEEEHDFGTNVARTIAMNIRERPNDDGTNTPLSA